MQEYKIENYEKEHGLGTFFPFRHLTHEESVFLRDNLRNRLKLSQDTSVQNMAQLIYDKSVPIEGVDAQNDGFNLQDVVNRLEIKLPEKIYLNWYLYDDIDEIRASDLLDKFNDIWYPSADDLDLIDPQMNWILVIHHYGMISFLSLLEI